MMKVSSQIKFSAVKFFLQHINFLHSFFFHAQVSCFHGMSNVFVYFHSMSNLIQDKISMELSNTTTNMNKMT